MEQIVDVPVLQVLEEIVYVVRLFLERIHQHIVEDIVDVPVPQIQEQIVYVIKVSWSGCPCTSWCLLSMCRSPVLKEIVEVVRLFL